MELRRRPRRPTAVSCRLRFPRNVDFRGRRPADGDTSSGPPGWPGAHRDARRRRGRREAGPCRDAGDVAELETTATGTTAPSGEMIENIATRVLDQGARSPGVGARPVVLAHVRLPVARRSPSPNLDLTIGSGGGSDVLLSDPTISRRHLGIDPAQRRPGAARLGSTNGTFVQGSRFQEITLGFGAEVTSATRCSSTCPTRRWSSSSRPTRRAFGSLVGRDIKMRRLFTRARARRRDRRDGADRGETGTGKELVARAHPRRSSPRASGPFVVLDCARHPARRCIESELFGHERGAFTGAIARPPGRLRERRTAARSSSTRSASCRSTLQPKLLRVLDEQHGAAASAADEHAQRRRAHRRRDQPRPRAPRSPRGRFREDLYYRLAVVAHRRAAAARAPRRHPAAGRALRARASRRTAAC